MLKNKKLKNGMRPTQYIVSWLEAGGRLYYLDDIDLFEEWLRSCKLTEDEIGRIRIMAMTGKYELIIDAREFLGNHN